MKCVCAKKISVQISRNKQSLQKSYLCVAYPVVITTPAELAMHYNWRAEFPLGNYPLLRLTKKTFLYQSISSTFIGLCCFRIFITLFVYGFFWVPWNWFTNFSRILLVKLNKIQLNRKYWKLEVAIQINSSQILGLFLKQKNELLPLDKV